MASPRTVRIPADHDSMLADLSVPERARGIVLFAHGSGSGRSSPRNRFVAHALEREGLATVLLDLLTEREAAEDERTYAYRFRIPLLAGRLVVGVDWTRKEVALRSLPVGLYGASTGGAAALIAAAERPDAVRALVLRGARSDLGDPAAPQVKAPTLFLVGELDDPILEANRITSRRLAGPSTITVVAGATHLFEEPGALEAVADHTVRWFARTLVSVPA